MAMENLPAEIILNIISNLSPTCIAKLKRTCRVLKRIASDSSLWQRLCYDSSPSVIWAQEKERLAGLSGSQTRKTSDIDILIDNISSTALVDQAADSDSTKSRKGARDVSRGLSTQKTDLAFKKWDPTTPGEQIDWSAEYVARQACLRVDWLRAPLSKLDRYAGSLEARGVALVDEDTVLAPFSDGSVRLWTLRESSSSSTSSSSTFGQCVESHAGLLGLRSGPRISSLQSNDVVECVAVDKFVKRVFFATGSTLQTFDLATFSLLNQHDFHAPISVISQVSPALPLTIGTERSLHLFDPRSPHRPEQYDQQSGQSQAFGRSFQDFSHMHSFLDAHMLESCHSPLSIVHRGINAIHVAGRFPSILNYDRRMLFKVHSTTHSGARISCISSIPTTGTASETASCFSSGIAAVGEYNGKGSLELYSFDPTKGDQVGEPVRNRSSASKSKCLSVCIHGTRIMFSDSDGALHWFERDGRSEARRWNINQIQPDQDENLQESSSGDLFGNDDDAGDAIRKILPVTDSAQSDVILWTGEKVGILRMGKGQKKQNTGTEFDDDESGFDNREEHDYGQLMRRALERHANDVRFVRGLGMAQSF